MLGIVKKHIEGHIAKLKDTFHIMGGAVTIIPDKNSYYGGQTVTAEITLKFKKPIKMRGIQAELYCHQKQRIKKRWQMDTHDYRLDTELGIPRYRNVKTRFVHTASVIHKRTKKIAGEGEYSKETFKVKLDLPYDAPLTSYEFGHDNKIYKWFLKVKLDVPLNVDKNAKTEILVHQWRR